MAQFKENNMAAKFQNVAAERGDIACISYKKDGNYTDVSWNEMNSMVHDLAYYLLSIGVKKGDRVGLFSANGYKWWVADLAIISIGAVNVPIYSTNSTEEAQYVLSNSGATICFVGSEGHLKKIIAAKKKLPKLKNIITFGSKGKKLVFTLNEAYEKGKKYKSKSNFDKRLKGIKPDDLMTIIYTSGTTGPPKGVMLTHKNIFSNVSNTLSEVEDLITSDEIFLSFLPLSHSLERTVGYYIPVFGGAKVAFAEDITTLMENFQEIRPTVLVSVPRIYEKVHAGIVAKAMNASPVKKAIFNFAMDTAKKNLPYACRLIPRTGLFALQYKIANKLVFTKLRKALGMDRLNFALSGGGPLSVSDAEFFIGMEIFILEGFGLSETSPITNFNRFGFIKPGTVGQAIPETGVKISDEGEILLKGPQIMKGYYKNPKATKEVFTKDKYFKTGDIGVIDADGCLSITGRIKDIIVTAGGKNISPQNIENSLKESRFIEQVAIIGDRRKYLSALIIPSFEEVKKWASKEGLSFSDNSEMTHNKDVIKRMGQEVEKYTAKYARV